MIIEINYLGAKAKAKALQEGMGLMVNSKIVTLVI